MQSSTAPLYAQFLTSVGGSCVYRRRLTSAARLLIPLGLVLVRSSKPAAVETSLDLISNGHSVLPFGWWREEVMLRYTLINGVGIPASVCLPTNKKEQHKAAAVVEPCRTHWQQGYWLVSQLFGESLLQQPLRLPLLVRLPPRCCVVVLLFETPTARVCASLPIFRLPILFCSTPADAGCVLCAICAILS